MFLLFLNGQVVGQELCQLPTGVECTEVDPSFFKVITTSKTFSQMINDGELLPLANSGTAPQFLVVCETITDDLLNWYIFAEGSEIIFLNKSSSLVVNSGARLQIRYAYLHGCQKLWDRIRVKGGGRLDLALGCRIEDAYTGVHLEPGSQFVTTLTTFNGNFIGVYAGGAGSPNQHSITATIGGNIFSGQKTLIENYVPNTQSPSCFYTRPMYGVVAQNVRHLAVGVNFGTGTNQFRDFSSSWSCSVFNAASPTGVFAQNSSLTVVNSSFKNIANGGSGRGVDFILTPGAASVLNFTGLGKTGPLTFDNVQTGVYGLGNMNIKASRFNNLERGVYLTGNPAPYRVTINGNAFENVDDHTVFADQISPIKWLELQDNEFKDNDVYSGGIVAFPRSGIHIRSFVPGQQSSWVYQNTFLNLPKTGNFSFGNRGVWIRNLNGSLIEQNDFTDNFGATNMPYEGVSVFNASTRLWSNGFAGGGNWTQHPSTAIQVQESPMCWLNCNSADQTRLGWEFQGMNSDGASVERNQLNTHDRGLLLRSDAIIGAQNNRYNTWVGNTSNVEAQFEGRNPAVPADVNFVTQSRFRIHTPNMATDFWPNPRLFGTVADPSQWFITGQPSNVECIATAVTGGGGDPLTPMGITEADLRVMGGSFQPVKGYLAGTWEAALRLYVRLSQSPDLRPTGSGAAAWYAAQSQNTTGRLGGIYAGLLGLNGLTPQQQSDLDVAAAQCKALVEALAAKDEQIAAVTNDAQALALRMIERAQLEAQLAAANTQYEALTATLLSTGQSTAQQLILQLNGINTVEAYEADFKTVCRILLEAYVNRAEASGIDLQTLQIIASQCRYRGGLAVVQARASLGGAQNWAAYDSCPDAVNGRSEVSSTSESTAIQVYPNPAQNVLTLELPRATEEGRAELRDLNGRTMQEWNIGSRQQRTVLHLATGLPDGVYLLTVQAEGLMPQTLKVLIQR